MKGKQPRSGTGQGISTALACLKNSFQGGGFPPTAPWVDPAALRAAASQGRPLAAHTPVHDIRSLGARSHSTAVDDGGGVGVVVGLAVVVMDLAVVVSPA